MKQNVNKPFFLFLRRLLKLVLAPCLSLKGFDIVGANRLPEARRPCILICNHAAFSDTLYLIAALRQRFTVCGAQPKYFSSLVRRLVLAVLNIIRVESREQFMEDCCRLLKSHETILIYPAMGRVPDGLGEFKTWAAEVAIASRAPVIPLYLYGTTKGQRERKRLMVGEEIPTVNDARALTECFYQSIADLQARIPTLADEPW